MQMDSRGARGRGPERRNMQTKEFSLTLDMVRPVPFVPFEVTEGDTGNVLRVLLQNDGEPMLLNDCWVVIVYSSAAGFCCQDTTDGVTIEETAGRFTLLMDPRNYGPGNVSVDVQIYSGPSRAVLITSTTFGFRCRRSLISEGIIRANMAYPPLIAAAQEAMEAAAEARAQAASIADSLGDRNVQPNWAEADNTSDAFIRNKPFIPAQPSDIGAVSMADRILTLLATSWTGEEAPYAQTVAAAGVTDDCCALVAPDAVSRDAYAACGAYCHAQGSGTLTFRCTEKPEENLCVNVLLLYDGDGADEGVTTGGGDAELTNAELLGLWNNE